MTAMRYVGKREPRPETVPKPPGERSMLTKEAAAITTVVAPRRWLC